MNDANASASTSGAGGVPDAAEPRELVAALDRAFDYRGDVTLTLRDGRQVDGYIFDRRSGVGLQDSIIRMLPRDSDEKVTICYADIARIEFTGKDTAAGKSWETWLRKYAEKKLKGEKAEIKSEPLE